MAFESAHLLMLPNWVERSLQDLRLPMHRRHCLTGEFDGEVERGQIIWSSQSAFSSFFLAL